MDNVNHPEHYTSGGIECIDAIRASLGNLRIKDIKEAIRDEHGWGIQ